jgi:hypothetical protein
MTQYKETHYMPKKSNRNIPTLFYNIENDKIRYLSTCGGGWFYSSVNQYTEEERKEFINKLVKL